MNDFDVSCVTDVRECVDPFSFPNRLLAEEGIPDGWSDGKRDAVLTPYNYHADVECAQCLAAEIAHHARLKQENGSSSSYSDGERSAGNGSKWWQFWKWRRFLHQSS